MINFKFFFYFRIHNGVVPIISAKEFALLTHLEGDAASFAATNSFLRRGPPEPILVRAGGLQPSHVLSWSSFECALKPQRPIIFSAFVIGFHLSFSILV